jgi:hypothetical protein
MSKRIKSLLIAAALTLPILAATTATAGPDCEEHSDHSSCNTTTTSTTTTSIPTGDGTCAASAGDGHQVFNEEDGFTITIPSGHTGCVDWTTTVKTEWMVTVYPGRASSAYLNVRNSHPGDFCWLERLGPRDLKGESTSLRITHSNGPLGDGGLLPISEIGACGDEYADGNAAFVLTVRPSGKPSMVTVIVKPIPDTGAS